MRFYVGGTDHKWFDYLGSLLDIGEVDFWLTSVDSTFRVLVKGDSFAIRLYRDTRQGNHEPSGTF